jgi:hypothetical protein
MWWGDIGTSAGQTMLRSLVLPAHGPAVVARIIQRFRRLRLNASFFRAMADRMNRFAVRHDRTLAWQGHDAACPSTAAGSASRTLDEGVDEFVT